MGIEPGHGGQKHQAHAQDEVGAKDDVIRHG